MQTGDVRIRCAGGHKDTVGEVCVQDIDELFILFFGGNRSMGAGDVRKLKASLYISRHEVRVGILRVLCVITGSAFG